MNSSNSMNTAHTAEFSQDISAATGVCKERAYQLIHEIEVNHGYNCMYDMGVICVGMAGVGVMYLVGVCSHG
jgi:hypothetical protein